MIDSIIDVYHSNSFEVDKLKQNGILAVIHKATQGTAFRDDRYHERKEAAKAAGLLWGAYHFSTGEDVNRQVDNFLSFAEPADDELISLDWEPSDGPDMTKEQAREFVQLIQNQTGRWPVLYGGHLLRESVGDQSDSILKNCPLWYVRYAKTPIAIPTAIWPTYTLWQYTDGVEGVLEPKKTPGSEGADRSIFQGTEDELRTQWPFTRRDD